MIDLIIFNLIEKKLIKTINLIKLIIPSGSRSREEGRQYSSARNFDCDIVASTLMRDLIGVPCGTCLKKN